MDVTFRTTARNLQFPPGCVCCGGPPTERYYIYARKREMDWTATAISIAVSRNARLRTHREATRFTLPICLDCKRHTGVSRLSWAIGLFGSPAAAIVSIMIVRPETFAAGLLAALVAAGVVAAGAWFLAARRLRLSEDCARAEPVTVKYVGPGPDYEFSVANQSWGERFAKLNEKTVESAVDVDPLHQVIADAVAPGAPRAPWDNNESWSEGVKKHFVPGLGIRKTPEAMRFAIKWWIIIMGVVAVVAIGGFVFLIVLARVLGAAHDYGAAQAPPPPPPPPQYAPQPARGRPRHH